MRFFTKEYRRRRLAAEAAGRRFMSFAQAETRLQKALAGVAAGKLTGNVIGAVFGE